MKELLRLPGMIDAHVHLRDFAESDKEDWKTGTAAALAGGVVGVLDMPNNKPSVISQESLTEKARRAKEFALCDFGFHFGATEKNFLHKIEITQNVFGLKMYLNVTHGDLLLEENSAIVNHFVNWPKRKLILVHAEEEMVGKVLELVAQFHRPVHFCHISTKGEVELIREAKEARLPVTCEVTPHHLFLTREAEYDLGSFAKMKPPLGRASDVDALWRNLNLGVVDIIASDHAPHTKEEKLSDKPPFGVPGLETTIPLLLTAVAKDKLSLSRLVQLTAENPAKIFGIKAPRSFIEVDISSDWIIDNSKLFTKCGWSPFVGKKVSAKIQKVVIRGKTVFEDGEILAAPGFGKELEYARA